MDNKDTLDLEAVLINKQMDMEEANKKVKATDGSKVIEAEVVVDGQPQPASLLDKLKQIYKK